MREGEENAVPGNAEAVRLIERGLAVAKQGGVCYAALAMIQMPNLVWADIAGSSEMELAAEYALDQCKLKITQAKQKREMPPRDATLGADHVCFNLSWYPVCYDFLPWLVAAEMTRVREGAPAPLKVAFYSDPDDTEWITQVYNSPMFNYVLKPLIGLIGAVETGNMGGRSVSEFTYLPVTGAAQCGEPVPKLQASEAARITVAGWLEGTPRPVTITLREAGHYNHRNSNLDAWRHFAADLQRRGEQVIFVRDTALAEEPLAGFATCPAASANIDLRVALYEQARCNLFVANGPWNLALFGTRPWLMFNQVKQGDVFLPNNPGWWLRFQGIEDGAQFPWSQSDQRIIWETDDYENINRAWEKYVAVDPHQGCAAAAVVAKRTDDQVVS